MADAEALGRAVAGALAPALDGVAAALRDLAQAGAGERGRRAREPEPESELRPYVPRSRWPECNCRIPRRAEMRLCVRVGSRHRGNWFFNCRRPMGEQCEYGPVWVKKPYVYERPPFEWD